jgi:mannosyltransferase OCH1-like enzyme
MNRAVAASESLRAVVDGTIFWPVPRVIHQTWKDAEIPRKWLPYQESWRERNPGWEYRFWCDADNRRLIAERHGWFLPVYDAFPRDIQRVDAAKYFILYTFGGVYADLDCECVRSIDPLVEQGGAIVGRSADGVVECAFIASAPGHRLWPRTFEAMQRPPVIARLLHRLPGFIGIAGLDAAHVLFHTGPQMVGAALRRHRAKLRRDGHGDGITVLDSSHLSHRSWWRRYESHEQPEGFVVHHYANSWLEPDEARFVDRFTARTVGAGVLAVLVLFILAVAW